MPIDILIPHIEALIFASDKPLSVIEILGFLQQIFPPEQDGEKLNLEEVQNAIEAISEKYQSNYYAFEIRLSGGGYQFLTKPEYHKTVALIQEEKFIKKLSTAAIETLAIIAYKQPITKNEIEIIRGVNCDYAVGKLLEKELVLIQGRNENIPGKPLLYATSRNFMDYFGINSPEDLPKIKEIINTEAVLPFQVELNFSSPSPVE